MADNIIAFKQPNEPESLFARDETPEQQIERLKQESRNRLEYAALAEGYGLGHLIPKVDGKAG